VRYTVVYSRKIRAAQYETTEIGLSMEFDETTDPHEAFEVVKGYVETWIKAEPAEKKVEPVQPSPKPKLETISSISETFPPDLAGRVYFEQTDKYVLVKPREYLDTEKFRKIYEVVQEHGGEYVSAGKDSHWRIPRTAKPPQLDPDELEKLPWSSFREKDPQTGKAVRVGPGKPGWIMADSKGAEALLDLVRKHGPDVPVVMGEGHTFLVRLGGKEEQFLQRTPMKEGKKK